MAKLTITDDSGRERAYLLKDAVTMAGRASSNAIQINDEKSSRQHFKIELRDDGYYLVDMGSTNGTRLNGSKVGLPTLLLSGDVIAVGKCSLIFNIYDNEVAKASIPGDAPEPISPEVANQPTMQAADFMEQVPAAAPPASQPPRTNHPVYILRAIEGALAGKSFELGDEPLTLGRHASNTIQIEDEAASNYHAEVARENGTYVVSDLGSTNGTRVRGAGRTDFEKIVKMPLKTGMQIRVGKTLIEFQNIGAPEADDDDMRTYASSAPMDVKKLDEHLNASVGAAIIGGGSNNSGIGGKIAIAAGVLVVAGLGAFFVPALLKRSASGTTVVTPSTDVVKVPVAANLIQNPTFDLDIDDEGYPKEFQVLKGSPEAVISVTADAEHVADKPDAQKHGLQVSKGDAKSLLKPTVVECRDPIAIDAGKSYELSGWMRNEGDGIYGLRVTWLEGDRTLTENPIVVKGSQGWGKDVRTATVTPPVWATRARVGVFVQGKSGKTCFDELSFKEKLGAATKRPPDVKNNGIVFQFEGTKGAFSVKSQDKSIVEDGTLRLEATESKAASDLTSASKITPTKGSDAAAAGFEGRLFDFAQQDFANFSIAAKPGASGVDVNATLDLPSDTTSKPVMRFYVTGSTAQGDIEIAKPDGSISRLQGTEDKTDTGVKSVLFNPGQKPQFDLLFGKPASILLKREGKRRLVEIRFDSELLVSMAPEDVLQKQEMLASLGELKKAVDAKEWGAVETKLKAFGEKYSARFADAKDESAKITATMDTAWKATQDDSARLLGALQNAPSAELLDKARQANQRQTDVWKGTEKAPQVAEMLAQVEAVGAKLLNADAEKKAEESFASAQKNFDAGNFEVTVAILQKSILENPALATTKVAEKAKELLPKATAAFTRQKNINIIQDNLRAITKNYIAQKNYKEAIKIIETDPEYKANKADLKEIQAVLEDWKKKAGM